MNKNKYVIHYRNLQQCLELGMKLKKIHRVLKFKQKDWMKPYIDLDTERRKEATNEAMENIIKRIKIRVVKTAKDFIKYTSRPTCVNWKVLENNLAAIHEKKLLLTLNKSLYVGFSVLEIIKWEMYNFHYNVMIRKFNNRLLFTDTDSLCYEVHEKNPCKKCTSTKNYLI